MIINSIKLRNFRCFEKAEFHFHEKLTVIVGNNTSGKTTILQGLQVALGAYLNSLKTLPPDAAYRHNLVSRDVFRRFDESTKDFVRNEENTRIDAFGKVGVTHYDESLLPTITKEDISWWRELRGNSTTHSKECAGQLMTAVSEMERSRRLGVKPAILPLVLSFGAKRIDNQYRAAVKRIEKESRISKAYKSALRETADFQSAFDWLYRYDNNLKKGLEFEGTKTAFINALTSAIPALSDIYVDTKNNELNALVSVTGRNPEYQSYEYMSDGFKSIICIVAEIAHRCIELNGFLKEEAINMTPGIVMIDELDLYLHPNWQKHILYDLTMAFPNIQFIVTSHSPFIIQSVKSENLITLDGNKNEKDPLYRSIEEIVIDEMNMDTPRGIRYHEMIDKAEHYYQLVRQGQTSSEEARKCKDELDQIEAEFSDDPAYVALLKAERKSNETRR